MKQQMFSFTVLISAVLCLWTSIAFCQPFPEKPMARLGKGTISDVAYSSDGKLLAVAGSLGVWLYDTQDLTEVGLLEGVSQHIVISPNGEILASAHGGEMRIGFFVYGAYSFVFSADGQIFAYADRDKQTIRLWAVSTQQQVGTLEEHTSIVTSLAFSRDGKWLASGSADGIILLWEVNLPSGPVAVEPKGKQIITFGWLKRTTLLQNYPNPFNPETWIPFVLAESGEVEIRIYSTTGHLMRMLQLGRKEPGIYQSKAKAAYWNGKNDAGESVSSGVYFYELHAGQETLVRKAMLLK